MSSTTTILIVEDEALIAADIEDLCLLKDYDVCAVAHNAGQALIALEQFEIDIVLLDINISDDVDGIEIAALLETKFKIPYLFITSYTDKATLARVQSLNPSGYIVKPFNKQQFYAVLELAINSGDKKTTKSSRSKYSTDLSERELVIVELLLAGNNLKTIGEKLYLSVNTIKYHQKNIYLKLDVHSRAELFALMR